MQYSLSKWWVTLVVYQRGLLFFSIKPRAEQTEPEYLLYSPHHKDVISLKNLHWIYSEKSLIDLKELHSLSMCSEINVWEQKRDKVRTSHSSPRLGRVFPSVAAPHFTVCPAIAPLPTQVSSHPETVDRRFPTPWSKSQSCLSTHIVFKRVQLPELCHVTFLPVAPWHLARCRAQLSSACLGAN